MERILKKVCFVQTNKIPKILCVSYERTKGWFLFVYNPFYSLFIKLYFLTDLKALVLILEDHSSALLYEYLFIMIII